MQISISGKIKYEKKLHEAHFSEMFIKYIRPLLFTR